MEGHGWADGGWGGVTEESVLFLFSSQGSLCLTLLELSAAPVYRCISAASLCLSRGSPFNDLHLKQASGIQTLGNQLVHLSAPLTPAFRVKTQKGKDFIHSQYSSPCLKLIGGTAGFRIGSDSRCVLLLIMLLWNPSDACGCSQSGCIISMIEQWFFTLPRGRDQF